MQLRQVAVFLSAMSALLFMSALPAGAAVTTGVPNAGVPANAPTNCAATPAASTCTAAQPCSGSGKTLTIYVPHNSPGCARSMEGCVATARKSLSGHCVPMTVDCVRLGQCKYATCASDSSNYGKYFNLGSVTYRSALDMEMHTVPNVICFVHDTGGAFRGRPDKLDLATTVCPTCTDAQAGAIARNAKVQVTGPGLPDGPGAQPAPSVSGYPSAQLPFRQPYQQAMLQPSTVGQPSAGYMPQTSMYPSSIQPFGTLASPALQSSYPTAESIEPPSYTTPVTNLLSAFLPKPASSTKTSVNTNTIFTSIGSSTVSTISNIQSAGGTSVQGTTTAAARPAQPTTNTFTFVRTADLSGQSNVISVLQNIVNQMRSLVESIVALLRAR